MPQLRVELTDQEEQAIEAAAADQGIPPDVWARVALGYIAKQGKDVEKPGTRRAGIRFMEPYSGHAG